MATAPRVAAHPKEPANTRFKFQPLRRSCPQANKSNSVAFSPKIKWNPPGCQISQLKFGRDRSLASYLQRCVRRLKITQLFATLGVCMSKWMHACVYLLIAQDVHVSCVRLGFSRRGRREAEEHSSFQNQEVKSAAALLKSLETWSWLLGFHSSVSVFASCKARLFFLWPQRLTFSMSLVHKLRVDGWWRDESELVFHVA